MDKELSTSSSNIDTMSGFIAEYHRLIVMILLIITICLFLICVALLVMLRNLSVSPSLNAVTLSVSMPMQQDNESDAGDEEERSLTVSSVFDECDMDGHTTLFAEDELI